MKALGSMLVSCAGLAAAAPASAHPGHGLIGAHWHATDAWGWIALAAIAAAAIWFARRK